jgi:phenylalanyl-tRNA synthetase beta chain
MPGGDASVKIVLAANADPIRVLNPIAAPLAVMRSSLLGSLVQVLRFNLARKAGRVRVFEIGRVFRRDATVPDGPLTVAGLHQPVRVAGLASGAADGLQWSRKEQGVDFYDAKGDIEALLAPRRPVFVADTHAALHPGRCARVEIEGRCIGYVGELHP